MGAASGTAVVAAGIVTALVVGSGGASSRPATLAGAGSANTTAAGHDRKAPSHNGETTEQTKRRLATALTAGVTAALPGARLSDGPTGEAGVVIYKDANSVRYDTDAVVTTADGSGELGFVSTPPGSSSALSLGRAPGTAISSGSFTSCASVPSNAGRSAEGHQLVDQCAQSTGPAGQTVVVITERCVGCPNHAISFYDVHVTWSNASVELILFNTTKRGDQHPLTAPLLNPSQLVAIATNPDLTVTP